MINLKKIFFISILSFLTINSSFAMRKVVQSFKVLARNYCIFDHRLARLLINSSEQAEKMIESIYQSYLDDWNKERQILKEEELKECVRSFVFAYQNGPDNEQFRNHIFQRLEECIYNNALEKESDI